MLKSGLFYVTLNIIILIQLEETVQILYHNAYMQDAIK